VSADTTATRLLRLTHNQEYQHMGRSWFGRKKFGFGVSPITWEGWVCTLLVIAVFTGFVLVFLTK
jgi:hypothetical protein